MGVKNVSGAAAFVLANFKVISANTGSTGTHLLPRGPSPRSGCSFVNCVSQLEIHNHCPICCEGHWPIYVVGIPKIIKTGQGSHFTLSVCSGSATDS